MTTINVIIATYNRSHIISICLDGLLKQNTDGTFSFNVIVVDNNSNDDTRKVVTSYREKYPGRVRYIFEPRQGKSHALNAGIMYSAADIITITDDDVQLDPHWLLNIVRCFRTHDCDMVGGRILPIYTSATPQWVKDNAKQLEGLLGLYDYGTETKLYAKPMYEFYGANISFKRKVIDDCGIFRTDLGIGQGMMGEDTEFVYRVLKAGKTLYYCGQALVWHPMVKPVTLKYIAQWNIALGRYYVTMEKDGKIDQNLTYYFGVPRYLIREMLIKGIRCMIDIFNRNEFLRNWIALSRNWGRAIEIQRIYSNRKS